eukprot:2522674-Pyramimonas_sp.AAC.1
MAQVFCPDRPADIRAAGARDVIADGGRRSALPIVITDAGQRHGTQQLSTGAGAGADRDGTHAAIIAAGQTGRD